MGHCLKYLINLEQLMYSYLINYQNIDNFVSPNLPMRRHSSFLAHCLFHVVDNADF